MRWRNHSLVSGAILLAVGSPIALAAATAIGATLPDRIETPFGPRGLRLLAHRGRSHEILLWLAVLGAWAWIATANPFQLKAEVRELVAPLLGLPIGGILHLLAGDIFTPGGILVAGHRIALPLFRTGTWREDLFSWAFASVCFLVAGIHLQR